MAMEKFIKAFEDRTKKSKAIWQDAKTTLPGGVAGNAAYLSPHPIYMDKCQGGRFVDVDGNEYIDLLLGGFPNIFGHSPKFIVDAVKKQIEYGTNPIIFQENGVKLAKKISQHMPHLEMIRLTNTGSEGTQFALRAARSWTKKVKLAKMEGGYHGQHDSVLISGVSGSTAGTDDRPLPAADGAGIPQFNLDNTVVLPFNNIEATEAIIEEHSHELAAVMLEPMAGFGMGDIPADKEYMESLRKLCTKNNIVLIYDEVVTGYRVGGLGGATQFYGVAPDLACLGKPIGGGFPIGAFGGRRDIMDATCNPTADPEFKIFQSGTFTGNPVSSVAGLACITELEKRDYSVIDNLGEKLRQELQKIAKDEGFELQMTGMTSMFFPHFNDKPIRNNRDKLRSDTAKNREFCMGMIVNGIYFPPVHPGAICFAHTEADVDQIIHVAKNVLKDMKK